MTRRLERHPVPPGGNSLHHWRRARGFWRVAFQFAVITLARYLPWLELKNALYRLIGMQVGKGVSFGLAAMVDIFFPDRIRIGDNTIIGYNTVILAHEFLIDEWRVGTVEIGREVMIGANCTILPGVRIGDRAVIGAGSVVNRDVPAGAFVGGVPARVIRHAQQHTMDMPSS